MKTPSWIQRTISIIMVVLASVSLFLAQSSYWVNHTIFNQENFSATATQAVLEPTSRDAIASTVVDTALQDRPIIQRVIGDRAQKLVSSLLGSDFSSQAVSGVVGATYKYITTPNRQDIALELTAIKSPVSKILTLVQGDDSSLATTVNNIPDEIVLVESDSFPDLSGLVSVMLWVGPLFWLASALLFAGYIYINRKKYAQAAYIVAASIGVVAIVGILTRPFAPPPIASLIPLSNLRPVVQNISDAFLAPFQTQMVIMLVVITIVTIIFGLRNIIIRQVQKIATMILPKPIETVTVEEVEVFVKAPKKKTATKTTKKK